MLQVQWMVRMLVEVYRSSWARTGDIARSIGMQLQDRKRRANGHIYAACNPNLDPKRQAEIYVLADLRWGGVRGNISAVRNGAPGDGYCPTRGSAIRSEPSAAALAARGM